MWETNISYIRFPCVYYLESVMKREDKGKKKQNGFDPWRSVAVASGAGFSLLTCMGIGVWSGIKCDEYFGTYPYGLIFLSLLGAVAGLWSVIRQMLEK